MVDLVLLHVLVSKYNHSTSEVLKSVTGNVDFTAPLSVHLLVQPQMESKRNQIVRLQQINTFGLTV